MTDKKAEPMTLDEFEKLLYKARKEAAEYWDKDHRTTQHSEGVYDGLDQAYEFFERFRPALEAGMRGVLRFKLIRPNAIHFQYHAIFPDDTGRTFGIDFFTHGLYSKEDAEQLASIFNMTAVFVEVTE